MPEPTESDLRAAEEFAQSHDRRLRWVHWPALIRDALARFAAEQRERGEAAARERLTEQARHLDDLLLRFAFDAGAIGDEKVAELGVDPWGTLADFRRAFGLRPTLTPEEWDKEQ